MDSKKKAADEENAKAPIKNQMSVWVDGFSLNEINIENEKKDFIIEKFLAFKRWAQKEIESM